MIFIYITNPDKKTARKIANHLLRKKLIACANIHGSVESIYPWEGKITHDAEYILIAKTLEKHFERIKKEVESIHPYNVPCIIKIPVSSNEKYFEWLINEIKSG